MTQHLLASGRFHADNERSSPNPLHTLAEDAVTAFPEIEKIRYEGPKSNNPLAFRWYNPDEVVEGKTMKEHVRFTVGYWHTFRGTGGDPFGRGMMLRP